MSPKKIIDDKSVPQRVANEGSIRKLPRNDAFTAYVMDRVLYRLGISKYANDFFLKGGVLVANLVAEPHRHTRDIDLLRRSGSPEPNELREIFREVVAGKSDDGIQFDPGDVRAVIAERETDDYDGVKVWIMAHIGKTEVEISVDIGFGDAVIPAAGATTLRPFLRDSPPPRIYAYQVETVLAEKIQTIIGKFPQIRHRLKDILDVVTLAASEAINGVSMARSLQATLERRATMPDIKVLDDLRTDLRGKKWRQDWATMCSEKRVDRTRAGELHDAVESFNLFVGPLLTAIASDASPGHWGPGGPWSAA